LTGGFFVEREKSTFQQQMKNILSKDIQTMLNLQ
jgi:hypothetical protein